jgi:hypothetical protein
MPLSLFLIVLSRYDGKDTKWVAIPLIKAQAFVGWILQENEI